MEVICDGVWQESGPPVRMAGGVKVPSRSTVLQLTSGELVVYSPIAHMPGVDTFGRVAHIVEPNRLHHLFVAAARERWPDATLHQREFQRVDPSIDAVHIAGVPKIDEVVLFHRPSGTLVVADLFFNMVAQNAISRIAFAITGVGGNRVAQSREWRWACKDKAAARGAMERVLAWPIQRVAFCHGEPVAIDSAKLAALLRI
jgi:hypothetical protein